MVAAVGDLTDLATARAFANITDATMTGSDAFLQTLITSISATVIQILNRSVLADAYSEIYLGNGKSRLMLRQRPVIAVSSIAWPGITVNTQGDPFAGLQGVSTDGRFAILTGYELPLGSEVKVVYTAGYSTVPADISMATAELVAEAFARRMHVGETSRSQGGQVTTSFDTKAMHSAIASRLKNYMAVAPC